MTTFQNAFKMKTKLIVTLLFIGTWSISAQQEARQILDEVSKTLTGYNSLQADFSFTLSNPDAGIEDTFEGNLVIQGQKFRLKMMGMLIFCDGEKLWNYSEDLNEATLSDPDESEFFDPTEVFTLYQKDFDLKIVKQSGTVYDILLTPQKADQEYKKIIISLDKSKKTILGATYYGTDDNNYILKIKNTIPNIQVDDRFFIFDTKKYPGSTVYDMR